MKDKIKPIVNKLRAFASWYLSKRTIVRVGIFFLILVVISLPFIPQVVPNTTSREPTTTPPSQTLPNAPFPTTKLYYAIPLNTYLPTPIHVVQTYKINSTYYLLYTGKEYILVIHIFNQTNQTLLALYTPINGTIQNIHYNTTLIILSPSPETTPPINIKQYLCSNLDPNPRPPTISVKEGYVPNTYSELCKGS